MSDSKEIRISGFTIVRNATILDYPFAESVRSLLNLCDEVIINCGDSDDDTYEQCQRLESEANGRIKIIRSHWEREKQSGGFQLKHQSDRALQECRGKWCFYLQADEVLHESDIPRVMAAIKKADERPEIDGIVFDYLHFYGNFSFVMSGRNWYRREVRAFKQGRGIEAFRDAQGFRKHGNRLLAIRSGARVFHYGYVRTSESLQKKSTQMALWWGEAPPTEASAHELRKHVGMKRFLLTHPKVMQERVSQNAKYPDPSKGTRKWDWNEIKNAITLVWESVIPYRIGEFRNYDIA